MSLAVVNTLVELLVEPIWVRCVSYEFGIQRRKKKILQLPFRDLLSSGVFVVVGHICDPTVVYTSASYCCRPKASPFKRRADEPGSE